MNNSPVKTWLNENNKFVVNNREDDRFHFSYWVWPNQKGSDKIIPFLVGHLKELQQGQDCILMAWGWTIDLKHHMVKSVMYNPQLRDALVQKLKQIINNKFRIRFLPNDTSFSEIKVSTLVLVDQITKTILYNTITDLWLKFATVRFQYEKQYRWPPGSFDPSKYV